MEYVDPEGVLNEGEIYFRSSKEISDPMESTDPFTFVGEVLVSNWTLHVNMCSQASMLDLA